MEPGRYIVSTTEKQLYQVANQKAEPARYIYPPTYYPDALSRDMAQPLELAPGAETKVDITLQSIRGSRVSFVTVPASPNVIASIQADSNGMQQRFAQVEKSGVHIFAAVPPGSWKIVARGPFSGPAQQQDQALYGELPLELGSADVDDLKIPLSKLADIQVHVSGDTTTGVTAQLWSKDGPVSFVNPNPDGEFRGIPPGSYRITVNPPSLCFTSILSGSRNLLKEELTVPVGGSVEPILITESNSCPQLTLTSNAKGPVTAVIAGDSSSLEPRVVGIPGAGFTISLNPGEYKVYAFDDVTGIEYANPDAMRSFKSQTASLEAGQKASLQLEVNERHPK